MPSRRLALALSALVLAGAFWGVFDAAKHVPALAAVNPTADDPYDAIGSFAVQGALVLGALAMWRALRPKGVGVFDGEVPPTAATVGLLVLVTLVSDAIALARYAPLWVGTPAGDLHAAILASLGVGAALLTWAARRAAQPTRATPTPGASVRALVGATASVLVLAYYPESLRAPVAGALATAVIGALCLFVPTRLVLDALLPRDVSAMPERQRLSAPLAWALAALAGLLAGSALLLGEVFGEGGSGPPAGRLLLVIAVFVGLETVAVLLGYALLRDPLGLPGASSG